MVRLENAGAPVQTKRHPSPLLIVTISLAQMITIAQKLTVLAKSKPQNGCAPFALPFLCPSTVLLRFKIGWDEPFLSVLHSIQLLNFDLKHISIDCISQVAPLVEFSISPLAWALLNHFYVPTILTCLLVMEVY